MKSIQTLEEYSMIYQVVEEAQERLDGIGGTTGIHYSLAGILWGYGIFTNSREDVVRQGWSLLKEYEKENF